MRRNICRLKPVLIVASLCIFMYMAFSLYGGSHQSPSSVSNVAAQASSQNGKSILRQIFNVVHSSFDNPKMDSDISQAPLTKLVKEDNKQSHISDTIVKEDKKDNDAIESEIIVNAEPVEPKLPSLPPPPVTPAVVNHLNPHITCIDKDPSPRVDQRSGNYWVFYNYIRAEKTFKCNETITYTTHGEYTFLHNLEPLLKRWQGPMSVAIYAPGDDYLTAVKAIYYYRECLNTSLVKDLVTFHFYFPFGHMPNATILTQEDLVKLKATCDVKPAVIEEKVATYRNSTSLDYPVNVGRNIARELANSHFIFPSDIELYPSPGTIPAFLDMIRRNEKYLKRKNPRVFVNSIFEIKEDAELPMTKTELISMLKKGTVIPFHKKVCSQCHSIPKSKEWSKAPVRDHMSVFHVAKRTPPYSHWEPIYIGTNADPFYDERLTWEGRSDKMTQGYQLCVLDYDFMILDNAFLVHRPGIKTKADNLNQTQKNKVIAQNALISKTIMPELKKLYGSRKGCEK